MFTSITPNKRVSKIMLGDKGRQRFIAQGNEVLYREIYKQATGTDIVITDTKDDVGRIAGFECASVQNGTPTPDSPIPI